MIANRFVAVYFLVTVFCAPACRPKQDAAAPGATNAGAPGSRRPLGGSKAADVHGRDDRGVDAAKFEVPLVR